MRMAGILESLSRCVRRVACDVDRSAYITSYCLTHSSLILLVCSHSFSSAADRRPPRLPPTIANARKTRTRRRPLSRSHHRSCPLCMALQPGPRAPHRSEIRTRRGCTGSQRSSRTERWVGEDEGVGKEVCARGEEGGGAFAGE